MSTDPKSLAAEIEAASEHERTRLIAWLAEHQVSTGSTIDREMTADALMADFIAPRLAEIAALQSRAFEDGAPSLVARQAVAAMRRSYEHFDQQAALADCRDYQLGYHSGIRSALQAVGLWDAGRAALAEQEKGDA